jgi:Zn/Cd-binding protein ZinT
VLVGLSTQLIESQPLGVHFENCPRPLRNPPSWLYNYKVIERDQTLAPRKKKAAAPKAATTVSPVTFDVKEYSTAIDTISVDSEKVSVTFASQEKVYDYTFSGDLKELVETLEKYTKEQHLSLGKYFNGLVKDGSLSQKV